MITVGCDVGSLTAEAVILNERAVLSYEIIKVLPRAEESALEVTGRALDKVGLSFDDIACCVGTGYGRQRITFIDEAVSEISCHACGSQWLVPSVRTVIDIGGQDCKAIRVDAEGSLLNFVTNDKCAAGTGRFLEVMAKIMGIGVEDIGPLSIQAKNPLTLNSTCTVWAQAEVIYHINEARNLEDISAGINQALTERVKVLLNRIGVEKDVAMTGGVAKNKGLVRNLERTLGVRIRKLSADPQIIGALGAAVIARRILAKDGA